MARQSARWRFRITASRVPLESQFSVGLTIAYQGRWLAAWRGVMITTPLFSVNIGFTFGSDE